MIPSNSKPLPTIIQVPGSGVRIAAGLTTLVTGGGTGVPVVDDPPLVPGVPGGGVAG